MQQRPSETLWQSFGAWVKSERESKRLTQAEAAKLADIDRQQWYRIESGKSGTKRDTAIAIAQALKVSEDEALRRAGYASIQPEETHDILDIATVMFHDADRLTPEDKEELLKTVRRIAAGMLSEHGKE